MDTAAVKGLINQYSQLALQESPVLLFEFHGTPVGVKEQANMVQEIAKKSGGLDFNWAI